MNDERLKVPKQSKLDAVHSATKAVISMIPYGGAATEFFQLIIQPPYQKRLNEWLESAGEKIQELEKNGLDIESLRENDAFISAVAYALKIVLQTHEKEKLEALHNAVMNVATGQAPYDAKQHLFLNFIDTFTELHIRILRVFQSPKPPPDRTVGGLSGVLEYNLPDTIGQNDVYEQIWKDLGSKGLVKSFDSQVVKPESIFRSKLTTDFGDSFLDFITNPDYFHKSG